LVVVDLTTAVDPIATDVTHLQQHVLDLKHMKNTDTREE
jgi:hypothetical protein